MFGWPRARRSGLRPPDHPGSDASFPTPLAAFPDASELLALLEQIEATALQAYAQYGLPTTRGHYGKSPRARQWKFLDADLTAEERFALVVANPKWRFATLEEIGRRTPGTPHDLAIAAGLLAECRALRAGLKTGARLDAGCASALIRLGADWRMLEARLERQRSGALRLSLPRRNPPRADQDNGARVSRQSPSSERKPSTPA